MRRSLKQQAALIKDVEAPYIHLPEMKIEKKLREHGLTIYVRLSSSFHGFKYYWKKKNRGQN